jgi:hypothetical protein
MIAVTPALALVLCVPLLIQLNAAMQNASLINTVLAAICAKSFKDMADELEGGKSPLQVLKNTLKESWKVSSARSYSI